MVRIKGGYNFIDVRDVANATIQAGINETKSSYLLTGKNVSIDELVTLIYDKLQKKHLPLRVPLWLANTGLFFIENYNKLLSKDTPYNRQTLRYLGSNYNYINNNAVNDLNLQIRDIKDSISDTIEWFILNKL
jgi:dihydroflavonol-4-reductase